LVANLSSRFLNKLTYRFAKPFSIARLAKCDNTGSMSNVKFKTCCTKEVASEKLPEDATALEVADRNLLVGAAGLTSAQQNAARQQG
jgi:hypothetical protein